MEFDLPRAAGLLALIVAVGVGGIAGSGVMGTGTVLTMVAPMKAIFGLIAFLIGMKHGEFRATHG